MGMVKGDTNKTDEKGWSEQGVRTISVANNKFAFELYFKLKEEKNNIFFSPLSIQNAFLIVYEGAKENTEEEIEKVFYLPEDKNLTRSNFAKIYREINKKDKKYVLYTANALWVQEGFKILKDYMEIVKDYYMAEIQNLDFVKEPENSVNIINSWVLEKTKDKIKDLISKDAIGPLTRLIITNAIYFKGKWLKEFDKEKTKEEDFWISENDKVKVPMMHMEGEMFNYYEDEKIQVLEIPYDGKEASMIIFLPKLFDLSILDEYLTPENIEEIIRSFKREEVNVSLPRFKIETKYLLKETLKEMGIKDAFTTAADFSEITGKKDLFISKVIHKAFVEVNEEGTEAAAATGVVMELTMVKPVKTFRADHPFVFIIYEKKYGTILFLGRVINPSK